MDPDKVSLHTPHHYPPLQLAYMQVHIARRTRPHQAPPLQPKRPAPHADPNLRPELPAQPTHDLPRFSPPALSALAHRRHRCRMAEARRAPGRGHGAHNRREQHVRRARARAARPRDRAACAGRSEPLVREERVGQGGLSLLSRERDTVPVSLRRSSWVRAAGT